MASFHFSWKTTNYNRTLNFYLIPLNWNSNTCCIYLSMVFFGWFFNTFKIVFTEKILQMDSHSCFNLVFILHKITFHIKLHVWVAHLLAIIKPLGGVFFYSQATLYAFNFTMLLQHIFPNINLE